MRNSGRYKEITKILNANRIAALGRMMLGKLKSWADYTYANESASPDQADLQIQNQEYASWFIEFKNTIEKKGEDVNDS